MAAPRNRHNPSFLLLLPEGRHRGTGSRHRRHRGKLFPQQHRCRRSRQSGSRRGRFRLPASAGETAKSAITASISIMDYRSEEHTSELQSLMRISYAVFCLKKKTSQKRQITKIISTTEKQIIRLSVLNHLHTKPYNVPSE